MSRTTDDARDRGPSTIAACAGRYRATGASTGTACRRIGIEVSRARTAVRCVIRSAIIATAVQGRVFTAHELRQHAKVDVDLQRAISGLSTLRLGKNVGVVDQHAGAGADDDRGV